MAGLVTRFAEGVRAQRARTRASGTERTARREAAPRGASREHSRKARSAGRRLGGRGAVRMAGVEPARCYSLVPESRRESVVSALYALNTSPRRRFLERVQCISVVSRELLDSGGLCKLALRHTTAR